jgi:hypothetical protein
MRGWREDPLEAWTVEHVAREFGMRLQEHNRNVPWNRLPMYYDGKELRVALLDAQEDHGVTVRQMLASMDTFFANPPSGRAQGNLVGYFMEHISRQLTQSSKTADAALSDEYIKQLEDEYASRPGWGNDV